jgi:hypothetical protein
MSFKETILYYFSKTMAYFNVARFFSVKPGNGVVPPFKLVFFCGGREKGYLNASLMSVYKNWTNIPELFIVTDGTDPEIVKQNLIKWPQKITVITWKECAAYFEQKGYPELARYAAKELWGKKFASVLYCAAHFPTLYTDTDILWFKEIKGIDPNIKPLIKMSQDAGHFYSIPILEHLHEEQCLQTTPRNAGMIYANGDFTSYPKWKEMCSYLDTKPDHRTEQTSFAILNNYFDKNAFFSTNEVLIKIDDAASFRHTLKSNPDIMARHYVSVKHTTFWRDFVIMGVKKFFKK